MKHALKQLKNSYGFTLIEMIFCISVILVILLLVVPNVTSKNNLVKNKSCDAQVEVVNSQIVLYEIDTGHLPTSMSQLTQKNRRLVQTIKAFIFRMDMLIMIQNLDLIIQTLLYLYHISLVNHLISQMNLRMRLHDWLIDFLMVLSLYRSTVISRREDVLPQSVLKKDILYQRCQKLYQVT